MLEHDDRKHAAAELIAALPCHVELPAKWRDNFEKHGLVPFDENDRRRFARVNCRSLNNRAAMQCQSTLPRLRRELSWHSVYVTDISRDGLGLLHSAALYPHERLRLMMLTGTMVQLEVVCCRRVHTRCFEIGTELVSDEKI
jgi:hypothetical protein